MAKDIRDTFGPDSIELKMRDRIRTTIEALVNEELDAALGASKSERVDERRGYRHGHRERTITTSLGPTKLSMPRSSSGEFQAVLSPCVAVKTPPSGGPTSSPKTSVTPRCSSPKWRARRTA